jgi:hypothetical protein
LQHPSYRLNQLAVSAVLEEDLGAPRRDRQERLGLLQRVRSPVLVGDLRYPGTAPDAVRLNANKHGLRSQEVLLPGEDGEALKELDENLRAELQPVGELENLLVDRIIAAHWRLRRLGRVEAGIFVRELSRGLVSEADSETDTATLGMSFIRDANGANAFSKLSRYETTIERSIYKALHELQRLQAARHTKGDVLPPIALDVDVSGVSGEGV